MTRVQKQREEERQVLENIKKKMDILRHKRIQGSNKAFTEPDEHFQGNLRSGPFNQTFNQTKNLFILVVFEMIVLT